MHRLCQLYSVRLPVGMVRALRSDPETTLAAELQSSRHSRLHRMRWHACTMEFDVVAEVLAAAQDSLFAASILWLTYLPNVQQPLQNDRLRPVAQLGQ